MIQQAHEEEKKRMITLLRKEYGDDVWFGSTKCGVCNAYTQRTDIETVVDYLLSNGTIMPPCKVGDTVYAIAPDCEYQYVADCDASCTFCEHRRSTIETWTVKSLYQVITVLQSWGTRCFATYEAAEQALKERD